MKILFVIYHPLGFGGGEISTKLLAEGLKKRGHEIVFVSNGKYDGFKNYRLRNFKKMPFFLQNSYLSNFLKRVIKKEKPAIIHAHDRLVSVGSIKATKSLDIPVVVHFRDYWFACPYSSCIAPDYFEYDKCTLGIILKHYKPTRWLVDIYKLAYLNKVRKILDKADLKIANSSSVKRRLDICGIKDAKVFPILRDLSKFSSKIKKNVIKKRFNIGDKVITYVGGLTIPKGILFITEVISNLLSFKKDWYFLIVGDGPLFNEVNSFINNRGLNKKIKLTGNLSIEDMPYVYADSDIVVLPSLWEEPFSGVPIEAGASHVPVIASDKGGNRDIITNKKNGVLVAARNKNEWEDALLKLMNNNSLRNKLGRNSRSIMLSKFSINKVSASIEKEYLSLIR